MNNKFKEQILNLNLSEIYQKQKIVKLHNILIKVIIQEQQKQIQNIIKSYFKLYSFRVYRKFLCAKVFKSQEGLKYKVLTCLDCRKQENSILCDSCFDESKHVGHNIKEDTVRSGICDCGDKYKWNEKTFCNIHTYIQQEDRLSDDEHRQYRQLVTYILSLVIKIYQIYVSMKDMNDEVQNSMRLRDRIDVIGELILIELIQMNRDRIQINRLTCQVIDGYTLFKQQFTKIGQQLLLLIYLLKVPQKIVELYILLFYENIILHEQITIRYIQLYRNNIQFVLSSYHNFSAQLLSNSLTISYIAEQKNIFFIPYKINNITFDNIIRYYEYLRCYYNDLSYIMRLRQQCGLKYWCKLCKDTDYIIELCNYNECLMGQQILDQFNSRYYDIESKFMRRFIKILNIIKNDKPSLKNIIKLIYSMINNKRWILDNNMLFTYQRMWSCTIYIYMVNYEIKHDIFNSIKRQNMINLYRILGLNKDRSRLDLMVILQRLMDYFVRIDRMLYMVQYEQVSSRLMRQYYESSNILILVRLIEYIDQNSNGICEIIQKYVNEIYDEIRYNLQKEQQQQDILYSINKLLYLCSRIQQCIYSQLSDVVLICRFEERLNGQYRRLIRRYYQNLLKSIKDDRIKQNLFRQLSYFILFEENRQYQLFIKQYGQQQYLYKNKCDGDQINYKYYHLLRVKVSNRVIHQLLLKDIIHCRIYQKQCLLSGILTRINIIDILVQCFQLFNQTYLISQEDNGQILGRIIEQIWKLNRFETHQMSYHQYFQKLSPISFDQGKYIDRIYLSLINEQSSNIFDNTILNSSLSTQYYERYKRQAYENNYEELGQQIIQKYNYGQMIDDRQLMMDIRQGMIECCKCRCMPNRYNYQLCYVYQYELPKIFNFEVGQTYINFICCNHYIHRECMSGNRCVCGCGQRYNIYLFDRNNRLQTNLQIEQQQIFNDQFRCLNKIVGSTIIDIEIMNSIAIFIMVYLLSVDKKRYLQQNLQLYRNIYNLMRIKMKINGQKYYKYLIENINKYKFKFKQQSYYLIIYEYIIQNIIVKLSYQYSYAVNRSINIKREQKLYIHQILDNLQSNKQFRLGIDIQYQLYFMRLENNLTLCSSAYQSCCRQSNCIHFICVIHQECQNCMIFCNNCLETKIKQHIFQYHSNGEAILLKIDRGQVIYIYYKEQKLIYRSIGYIYLNQSKKQYIQSHNIDKDSYYLDQFQYNRIAIKYYTGYFLNTTQIQ